MNVFFSLFLLCVCHINTVKVYGQDKMLMWRELNIPKLTELSYGFTSFDLVVDGSQDFQALYICNSIYKLKTSFKYVCQIYPNELLDAKFCFRMDLVKANNEKCMDAKSGNFQINKKNVEMVYSKTSGLNVTFNFEKNEDSGDISGYYYCKFRNNINKLTSTAVRVIDSYSILNTLWSDNKNAPVKSIAKKISEATLPMTLDCPIINIEDSVEDKIRFLETPIVWEFCTIQDSHIAAMHCKNNVKNSISMAKLGTFISEYNIDPFGRLTIFSLNNEINQKFGLVCKSLDNPSDYAVFGGIGSDYKTVYPIEISNDEYLGNNIDRLSYIEDLNLIAGQYETDVKLISSYKGPMKKVSVQWYKDGKPQQTEQKFMLNLFRKVTKSLEGKYVLAVKVSGEEKARFNFSVKVVSSPTSRANYQKDMIIYKMANDTVTTKYHFDRASSVSININGLTLKTTSSVQKFQRDWRDRRDTINLANLDITVDPLPLPLKSIFTYTTDKLARNMDHAIDVVAKNDIGIVRQVNFVKVVDKPTFMTLPQSCAKNGICRSEKAYKFQCSLGPEVLHKLNDSGVQVKQMWFLDNRLLRPGPLSKETLERVPQLAFFTVKEAEGVLEMAPIQGSQRNRAVISALSSNNTVRCVVQLFAPSSGSTPLYDSREDGAVREKLAIVMRVVFPEVKPASMLFWLVLVVVVLVFLLAVVLVYLVWRRSESQTYNAHDEDIKAGKDPLKEIFEKQTFQTYTRNDEEDDDWGSSRSVGREDQRTSSLGVRGDRAPELDGDLEPAIFNEDASFIYEYGTQKGPRNGNIH